VSPEPGVKPFFWTRLVPSLALFKLASGLAAFFLTYGIAARDPTFPYVLYLAFICEFGIPAAFLFFGGRGDPRAVALGSFFLVAITAWCNRPLGLATGLFAGTAAGGVFHLADALELDCLMAFFLWSFVRDFPVPTRQPARRWVDGLVRVSAGAGLTLFGLNLILNLAAGLPLPGMLLGFLAELVPMRGMGIYYSVLMPLLAPAIPYLLWKGRSLDAEELRRVRLFLFGLAAGLGPMLLDVLAELFIAPYKSYIRAHPEVRRGILLVFGLCTLAAPIGTTYAVLMHRVLDVKLLARRAVQYTLARTTAIALATAPLSALVVYLYRNRERSIAELFSGDRLLLLLTAALAGAAALRYRRHLLDAIDRRFFREQYDARQILTLLVERIRATGDAASLASLIAREIDLALHLEGIALLVLDLRSGLLVDPRRRTQRLDASSPLALLIANASDPLSTDLEDARSPVAKLPDKERHWLVDNAFKLVVPILARDGSLLGLIGLGEKKSGLPFLREDRQLLRAVASSAAWVLELAQAQSMGSMGSVRRAASRASDLIVEEPELPVVAELAKECPNCGALFASYTVLCSHCSRRLEPSHVPFVLPGKFRFERRIGSGGMGVVYRGSDLSLGRPVAVKTLRRVSPEDAMRLRREARTAATVSHRHLAPIYGMETWQGTPMIVLELLDGGTLAQRLERGRMEPPETVELGIAVADALAELHSVDILHRDIKPSNIGFTRDGVPKLMDFGIARVALDLRQDRAGSSFEGQEDDSMLPPTLVWQHTSSSMSLSKQLVGTLSYLSPEALAGDPAGPAFDLWSLAIVLYECLLGRKVFGGDAKQVMARIKLGRVPELSQLLPDADEQMTELFRTTLHKNPARRPATARALKEKLEALRGRV
jgi:Protein kinase domain/GAF domain